MKKLFTLALATLLTSIAVSAQGLIVLRDALAGRRFPAPTEMLPIPGRPGWVAIAEQSGLVTALNLTDSSAPTERMLSIRSKTQLNGEMGLLGLAFHPQYPQVNKIFVNYVANITGPLRTNISSFTVNTATGVADTTSETVVLTYAQPFTNHKGGKVQFGPDGMLYIAVGDGGSANDPFGNAQNRRVLLGKMLRIDVNGTDSGAYSIPADNPFADSAAGIRKEIYAYGLRNPWRFSWDFASNRLWVADVGQDNYEEIDTLVNGGNYGWRNREGYNCRPGSSDPCTNPAFINPIWQYAHTNGNISITGGFVYHGSAIPYLQNRYIYADYGTGILWALGFGGDTLMVNTTLLDSPANIYAFGYDDAGELYVLSGNGTIFKIMASPTAIKPNLESTLRLYPNPARQIATLELNLPAADDLSIRLLNPAGEVVRTWPSRRYGTGSHSLKLNLDGLPTGLYSLQVETPHQQIRQRLAVQH